MRKEILVITCLILTGMILFSCKRLKKSDAEIEREEWINSFTDSIEYYKTEISNLEIRLGDENAVIAGLINDFEYVSNPRQVTGYYILKGWQNKLPMKKTGIYARINDNEELELIATLSGGNFNQILVSNGREEVESGVVPYDQALNYRHNNLNTVCFYGTAADSVAEFIGVNEPDKITVSYIEGNKKKQAVLGDEEKNMIARTWELYSYNKEGRELQKNIWIYSKKIDAYRRMMESRDSVLQTIKN